MQCKNLAATQEVEAHLPSFAAAETEALAARRVLMHSTLPDMAAACRGVTPDPCSGSVCTTALLGALLETVQM